jgi:hypothetical protein
MRPLQNFYFLDLTGANHLPGIRESHAVSPAIRYDDSTRSVVCFVARPVALELQKHLYPAGKLSAGLLQSAKSQVVAGGSQAATRVGNKGDLKSIFECRKCRKGNASFRKKSGDNQALPIGGNNCTSRSVILPNVHTLALDRLYGREGLLQSWKQRTAVDPRRGC